MLRRADEPCDTCKNRSIYRGLTGDFWLEVFMKPLHVAVFSIFSKYPPAFFFSFKSAVTIVGFPSIPLLCRSRGVVGGGQRHTQYPPLLLCANRRECLCPCLPSTEHDFDRRGYHHFILITILPVFRSGYLDVRSFTGMDNNPPQAVTPSGASCYASNLSPADTLYCKVQSPYGGTVCVQR